MADHDHDAPPRPRLPQLEPQECRVLAEDTERIDIERLTWAVLAVAGELHLIQRELHKTRR